MSIDNGRRGRLVISGVFEGMAGVQGNNLSFLPNRRGSRPEAVRGATLDGKPIRLASIKDQVGPFWTARFEVIE
jgi:hypothetical protein